MLLQPDRSWKGKDLAEESLVSPYTVHRVLRFMEEQLWVEKRGKGPNTVRRLAEPGKVLDAWAEAHSLREYQTHRFHRLASDGHLEKVVGESLEAAGVEHALTLEAGAAYVAPFVTHVNRLSVLVSSSEAARALESAGFRPVDEGENVLLLVVPSLSPLLFRRRIEEVWVASDVQLYLDLWASPRRGKEQARHLRSERLPY
jgi:hypothetical protein